MSGQRFVLVGFRHSVVPGWGRSLWCMLVILLGLLPIHLGLAQTDPSPKTGVLIDVPSPLNSR
ncbi:hypothetical protein, partial [Rhodopirellula bahusiensis]